MGNGWNAVTSLFGFRGKGKTGGKAFITNAGGSESDKKNLNNKIYPVSFERAMSDLDTLANALKEAEQASYPYRVELQRIYEKTILNAHVASCMQKREEITLLREYQVVNGNGERDKHWTEYFQKSWYSGHALPHTLNAQNFGYNLASIGAIKDGIPDQITVIKRWNISPERRHVSAFERSPMGYSWDDPEFKDWHVWIPTLQKNGINNCGYGLLLVASILEILNRNNLQYNADFIEMFANPFRWLKTNDTEGDEYDRKVKGMEDMGHNAYLITGLQDELSFLNDGSRGNSYKAYNDFDHRMKADMSKWYGGHANFLDGDAKSMDAQTQGGDVTDDATGNTPVQKAIAAKRKLDGRFAETATNELWIPTLQRLGIAIPKGHRLEFLNDSEKRAIAAQEADKNQKIVTIALGMAQAGLQMDPEWFTKQTEIPCKRISVMPDKNVLKDKKEQAAGKDPMKDESKKREDKPKFTGKRIS